MTPLITCKELADLLALSEEQIRRLTRDDAIPYHRVGSAVRYDYELVKNHTRTGQDAIDIIRGWVLEQKPRIGLPDCPAAQQIVDAAAAMCVLACQLNLMSTAALSELMIWTRHEVGL